MLPCAGPFQPEHEPLMPGSLQGQRDHDVLISAVVDDGFMDDSDDGITPVCTRVDIAEFIKHLDAGETSSHALGR